MRVALVTGGARRLGGAISRYLACKGFRVVINYRNSKQEAQRLLKVISDHGGEGLCIRADVTKVTQVERMFRTVTDRYGRIDVLVNNVGNYLWKPLASIRLREWDEILQNNLYSVFLCSGAALPAMRRQQWGRVINIGYAPAGKLSAFPKCTAYHIAKTGVLIYTKSLAVEEARFNITVNMVSPGTMFNSVRKPSRNPADYIPVGRFCRYEDILGIIDYLVREEASYITGGHFVVSGGYSI
jgi:3-oxoacyl-[acyl-carrier protein] reductase